MSDTSLVKHEDGGLLTYNQQQRQLIKDSYAKGATDQEFALFIEIAQRKGLDVFSRQVHMVKRWDTSLQREVMEAQTGIDGYRLMAERSKKYEGQFGPFWCDADGEWKDVWLSDKPPVAAKVGILKAGCREPFWAVALYREYVQKKKDGNPNAIWSKMPANQLAKCAESLALRKAFPSELAGIYTQEEMGQASNDAPNGKGGAPVEAEIIEEAPEDEEAKLAAIEAEHRAIEEELKAFLFSQGKTESDWRKIYQENDLADKTVSWKKGMLEYWKKKAAEKNGAAKHEEPEVCEAKAIQLTADHITLKAQIKQLLDGQMMTQGEIDNHISRICAGEFEVERLSPAEVAKAVASIQRLLDAKESKKGASR